MASEDRRAAEPGAPTAPPGAAGEGGPEEADAVPEGTLSRQIDELRRHPGTQADDGLRRRVEIVAAIAAAYEDQLRATRRNIRQLEDLFLPVCMFCKRVRTDDSYWERIERFFARHADVTFSHGVCPTCFAERFGALTGAPAAPATPAAPAAAPPGPAAPPASARAAGAARPPAADAGDDEALRDLRAVLEETLAAGAPQAPALQRAVDRTARALARYRKVVEISDGYQDEFRRRLERAVRADALTGLTTRGAAVELLEDAFDRARRGDGAPALVVVEIRGLRALNLRHGHETGDRALLALSRALRTASPTARVRARWAGNAFALLVDGAAAVKTRDAALRLLQAVIVKHGEEELSLTLEAGLAHARDAADAAAWIAAAEAAVSAPRTP